MGRLGPAGLFAYIAAVIVIVVAFILWRVRARGGVPRARRTAFVASPSAPARLADWAAHAVADAHLGEKLHLPFWRSVLLRWSVGR
jgi:hypothetical protein